MELADRTYLGLRPDERLRATVSAIARRDEAEQDRLIATCPEKHYTMRDARYSEPLKALITFATMHHLLMARHAIGVLCAEYLGHMAESKPEKYGSAAELADKYWTASVGGYRAHKAAWERFCRELKIPPAEMSGL